MSAIDDTSSDLDEGSESECSFPLDYDPDDDYIVHNDGSLSHSGRCNDLEVKLWPASDETRYEALRLKYRILGFPCSLGSRDGDGVIDDTWMAEDVSIMRRLLRSRHGKPATSLQDLDGMSLAGRQYQYHADRASENPDYPSALCFETYEQVMDIIGSPIDPPSLCCTTPTCDKSDIVYFVYVAGHGLNEELAQQIQDGDELHFHDRLGHYKPDEGTSAYQTLFKPVDRVVEHGHVVGFSRFIDPLDIISEFVYSNHMLKTQKANRHLVLFGDACYAGAWRKVLDQQFLDSEYDNGIRLSITIQTACDADQVSNGHYFTPLFEKLQSVSEVELFHLVEEFNKMNEAEIEELRKTFSQTPTFRHIQSLTREGSRSQRNAEREVVPHSNQFFIRIHGFRFFCHGDFFRFFARTYQSCTQIPAVSSLAYDDHLASDGINPPEPRLPRVILSQPASTIFFSRLLKKSISIKGMKLTQYATDQNKPMCIVALRSPVAFSSLSVKSSKADYVKPVSAEEAWYHLHVHFDGLTTKEINFPGSITSMKLLKADLMHQSEDGRETWIDDQADAASTRKTRADGHAAKLAAKCGLQLEEGEDFLHGWKSAKIEAASPSDASSSSSTATSVPVLVAKKLENWASSQISGAEKWRSKAAWSKTSPTLLGKVDVRHRDRALLAAQYMTIHKSTKISHQSD